MAKFQYKKRSSEAVEKRASQTGGGRDGIFLDTFKVLKIKAEGNNIRILPPTWDDPEHYGLDVWVHYGIGPDNAMYICLFKMLGKACPICEERKKAEVEGDADYTKALTPAKRVVAWAINRDAEKDGPCLWAMPWTLDRDICKQAQDKKTGEVLYIDNPDDGYDVEFDREGTGVKTKYLGLKIARRSSDLGRNADEWLEFVQENPIPATLQYFDYDYIAEVFAGGATDDKKEKEEEEKPVKEKEKGKEEKPKSERNRVKKEKESESEPKKEEEKEPGSEEPTLTYEDLEDMSRDELTAFAVEELDFSLRSIKNLNTMELLEAISEKLGLTPFSPDKGEEPISEPEPKPVKEEKASSYKEKLAKLRERNK